MDRSIVARKKHTHGHCRMPQGERASEPNARPSRNTWFRERDYLSTRKRVTQEKRMTNALRNEVIDYIAEIRGFGLFESAPEASLLFSVMHSIAIEKQGRPEAASHTMNTTHCMRQGAAAIQQHVPRSSGPIGQIGLMPFIAGGHKHSARERQLGIEEKTGIAASSSTRRGAMPARGRHSPGNGPICECRGE